MEAITTFYQEHPTACLIIVIILVLIGIVIMMSPFIIIMVYIGKRYLKKEPKKLFSIKELRKQEPTTPDYRLYEKETVVCNYCGCRSEYRHGFCMRCGGALPLPKERGQEAEENEKM